ncbi:hypothetical protein OPV22_012667 [Ensete ventricosum]|uniref:Uncharacterized protein n=1 Tax=Ensete ventricosum TaxID=4639 RepID=A0AAV8R362_ENSVE|nr:hypothetical protein OPV22_012667 [Ensete ventricosum]
MVGELVADEQATGTTARGDFVVHCWRPGATHVGDPFPQQGSTNGGGDLGRHTRAEEGTGYTSLRDLIGRRPRPGATWSTESSGSDEIRIKNHLVKQAAYAYLQPTPLATECRLSRPLRRVLDFVTCCCVAVESLDSCVDFLRRLFRGWRR